MQKQNSDELIFVSRFIYLFVLSLKSPEVYMVSTFLCSNSTSDLENIFTFKNVDLIIGVKPCYGGKSKIHS